ncbi:MAG TPA: hypothetical protein VJP45_03845 [Candidatus Limnocylindria bacterium]|nr:hypothetical protein [Candidatus Limnocylindria bacterium]
MGNAALVRRSLSFIDRLVIAFAELTLATAVIIGAIVVGHELREWREWYPKAYHPWLETRAPATEVSEPAERTRD